MINGSCSNKFKYLVKCGNFKVRNIYLVGDFTGVTPNQGHLTPKSNDINCPITESQKLTLVFE